MASTLEDRVWALLQQVRFPGMSRDIVSFGFVDRVEAADERVTVELAIATQNQEAAAAVRAEAENLLRAELDVERVEVALRLMMPRSRSLCVS
jgi:ATP-binding protein involved in chromosome partitioning